MTTKEAVALLERYSNYDGMGIPNLAGCKEAMRVAVDALKDLGWAIDLIARIREDSRLMELIDSLPEDHFRDSTKMISEDLEEAADSQIRKMVDAAGHPGWDWTTRDIEDAFIAGAKWQKAKDDKEREENKRKENELPRFYGD